VTHSRTESLVCDSSFEWQINKSRSAQPCHGDCEDYDANGWVIRTSIRAGDEFIEQSTPNPMRYCVVCALRRFPFVGRRGTPRGEAIMEMQNRRYEDMRRKLKLDAQAAKNGLRRFGA
jgi:hypothetical protein